MLKELGPQLHKSRSPLHIMDVSCSRSFEEIAKFKTVAADANVTSSTAAHYLFFTLDDVDDGATQFKCLPPILDKENHDKLIQALLHNQIDLITSSHFASLPQLKGGCPNFLRAIQGVSTIGYWSSHTR